jgi:hypothetical protein
MDKFNPDHPKPGIYHDVPWGEYFIADAVSHSTLQKCMTGCMSQARHLTLGNFVHEAFLDRTSAVSNYRKAQNGDRRKKVWREEETEAQKNGYTLLTPKEWDQGVDMIKSMLLHDEFKAIREEKGPVEMVVVWKDLDTDVLCKGRIDKECSAFLFDLKTTRCVGMEEFNDGPFIQYNYHSQAAMYHDGYHTLTSKRKPFVFGMSSKEESYPCWLHRIGRRDLLHGRHNYKTLLKWYKRNKLRVAASENGTKEQAI